MTVQAERYGTRHRAALGITEQTDAVVVVVSEESGQASLVERARIRRNLDEAQLTRALTSLLRPEGRGTALRGRLTNPGSSSAPTPVGTVAGLRAAPEREEAESRPETAAGTGS